MFRQKHTASFELGWCSCMSALLVLAAAGCTEVKNSDAPRTEAPSVAATSDEAQSLATSTYEAYLSMSDEIAKKGGTDIEVLSEVARGEALINISDDMRELAEAGLRITGSTRLASITVFEWDDEHIGAYVCEDVELVDVLDADGNSLVVPNRATITPFEVELESDDGQTFLLSERKVWTGKNFCT